MDLKFNSVELVGFGSYDRAKIDLDDQGFCLVSGENHYVKDNAQSNGSGKSTVFSAICYALCGETLSGVSKNLKNTNLDTDECQVTLDFNADSDHYVITRINRPKSDLKIIKNGVDESGKGIVESTAKLEALLPDLTKDLIASTILLGQGNVNKFSSFSPSGRKQLLEQLTKSDFQIEDIKNRLSTRQNELRTTSQSYRDSILLNQGQIDEFSRQVNLRREELEKSVKPDFDTEITKANEQLTAINRDITDTEKVIKDTETLIEKLNSDLLTKTTERANNSKTLTENYTATMRPLNDRKAEINVKINAVVSTLSRMRENPDVCPTCGQKLPNAEHVLQEKADKEAELKTLQEDLEKVKNEILKNDTQKAEYEKQISDAFDADITSINSHLLNAKKDLNNLRNNLNDYSQYLNETNVTLTRLNNDKANWDSHHSRLEAEIDSYNAQIAKLSTLVSTSSTALADVTAHLDVLTKIDTLIKRDFRGYLLEDIIKYIDLKAKEYCEVVFDTQDLEIKIEGNNLNITYCGKNFDNLSGGEKQRVDIILQFAIRDLLQNYMNYSSNIIVLDEIFDALDAKSTARIIDLISTKLQDISSVFVISHHASELGLSYDTEIKITKNESGISEIAKI